MTSTSTSPSRTPPPVIAGTGTALPDHVRSQAQMLEFVRELLPELGEASAELERLFAAAGVEQRHLALATDAYRELRGLAGRNREWIATARQLGERVVRDACADAELDPREVSLLVTTTVTGLAVPTLDTRLMNAMGLAPTVERLPLFGLGCVGGAAGLARTADYLRAYPDRAAVLLSVELCSLTVQRDDTSIANMIAAALFGDGAAAVVLVGGSHRLAARARPTVLDSRATLFPDTEAVMGFDIVDTGFRIVLGPEVPTLVERELAGVVDGFLASHELGRDQIDAWIAHPGGPRVIAAVERALELDGTRLEVTRASLARVGNLSSASVLFVLDEVRRRHPPKPGHHGLLFALGPAFCAEVVLLRW